LNREEVQVQGVNNGGLIFPAVKDERRAVLLIGEGRDISWIANAPETETIKALGTERELNH